MRALSPAPAISSASASVGAPALAHASSEPSAKTAPPPTAPGLSPYLRERLRFSRIRERVSRARRAPRGEPARGHVREHAPEPRARERRADERGAQPEDLAREDREHGRRRRLAERVDQHREVDRERERPHRRGRAAVDRGALRRGALVVVVVVAPRDDGRVFASMRHLDMTHSHKTAHDLLARVRSRRDDVAHDDEPFFPAIRASRIASGYVRGPQAARR